MNQRKIVTLISLLCIICIAVFIACNKSDQQNPDTPDKFTELATWFTNEIKTRNSGAEAAAIRGKISPKKILWNSGIEYGVDSTDVFSSHSVQKVSKRSTLGSNIVIRPFR